VAEEVIVERIGGRRSCPKCGAVYHVFQNPPARQGFCDRDGMGLLQRADDKPENVKKRLLEYAEKTRPLKRFYEERGLVSEIEGVGTPEGILAVTKKVLEPI
jgi:adenylate kinase